MLTIEEALDIVLAAAEPLDREHVPLRGSVGQALAQDIDSTIDLPPFDRSAMDGYALRSSDIAPAGGVLEIVGEIPAGAPATIEVGPGQTVRIMTGAPIPPGADAVQMVEKTAIEAGGARVRILEPVNTKENVRYRAEDLKAGTRVLFEGTPIRSAEIALLASLGVTNVPVRRRPRVALISTGDEIVEPDREPLPHQIRNSNAYAIEAILGDLHLPAEYLGIAPDGRDPLEELIRRGLAADVLCLTGGVSMGEYDLVGEVLRRIGAELLFHKVAIKPGKPLMFGRAGKTLIFGLPGNPVSAVCDFALFAVPALRRMLGFAESRHREVRGTLAASVHQKPGRTWYCLASTEWSESGYHVRAIPSSGSADIVAACRANSFAIIPADREFVPAGEEISVLLWGTGF